VQGTEACGIDGNNIVGFYNDSSGNFHGFIDSVSPVPEPSTAALALLAASAAGPLAWRKWRRPRDAAVKANHSIRRSEILAGPRIECELMPWLQ
jgi:hypothetical protein